MRGAILATAALVTATVVLGPSAAASDDELAEVLERNAQLADADLEHRETASITDETRADAVYDLGASAGAIALDPSDAIRSLETEREEEGRTIVTLTSDLLFEFGSATVTEPARAALLEVVDDIPEEAEVSVDGHTDSIGDDAANDALSRERAEAVAAVLRAERPDLRLTVTGHGERQPVADNEVDGQDNPAGRALNRRVEVSYASS